MEEPALPTPQGATHQFCQIGPIWSPVTLVLIWLIGGPILKYSHDPNAKVDKVAMLHPIIKPWPFRGWELDFIGQIYPPSSKGSHFCFGCYGLLH